MAWLRLTDPDGRQALINSDEVTEIYPTGSGSGVVTERRLANVQESFDEIAAMIEQAEWRERVLKCACAIMSNSHANGLTAEVVAEMASRLAAAIYPAQEPEKEQLRHVCERCGGTGVQESGCWTGKAYDSHAGRCELCDGKGNL